MVKRGLFRGMHPSMIHAYEVTNRINNEHLDEQSSSNYKYTVHSNASLTFPGIRTYQAKRSRIPRQIFFKVEAE